MECLRLLIIEDNIDDAFVLKESLTSYNLHDLCFEICHVERLADGLHQLSEKEFDIVLVDLSLPDSEGLETFDTIQQQYTNQPIIVLSGLDDEEIAVEAVQRGAQDYLVKGIIDTGLLIRSIRYGIERKRGELALRDSETRLKKIIDKSGDGIVIVDETRKILFVNPAAETLFNRPIADLFGSTFDYSLDEQITELEIFPVGKQETIFVELRNVKIEWEGKNAVLTTLRDITERKMAERRLQYLATHDSLTSLPNRALFYDRLNHALAQGRRNKNLFSILYLDLDGFKSVNDRYGHDVGDDLLQLVSRRFRSAVRESDTVARLGGDEFTFIIENILAVRDAERVTKKILESLKEPFHVANYEIVITASIGISVYPQHGENADILVKKADMAMYEAKQSDEVEYRFCS
jgi:diguanylate cyclase (GGDEF)-like protein